MLEQCVFERFSGEKLKGKERDDNGNAALGFDKQPSSGIECLVRAKNKKSRRSKG